MVNLCTDPMFNHLSRTSTTLCLKKRISDIAGYNLVNLQLILILMCESPNLIIFELHCWAVKLKAILKTSEVDIRSLAV